MKINELIAKLQAISWSEIGNIEVLCNTPDVEYTSECIKDEYLEPVKRGSVDDSNSEDLVLLIGEL